MEATREERPPPKDEAEEEGGVSWRITSIQWADAHVNPAEGDDKHWRTVLGPKMASAISKELGYYEIDLSGGLPNGKRVDAHMKKFAGQLNLLNTGIQIRRKAIKKKGEVVWADYRAIFDTALIS
jgi:hypothetical protein